METIKTVTTPIYDFARQYSENGTARFHMPGHKGRGFFGFEEMDITEVKGADSLYEADGIIAESEDNASKVFGSGLTLYSAEGSSLCIKTMVCAASDCFADKAYYGKRNMRPLIMAARNVHKSFLYGLALSDTDAAWISTSGMNDSICTSRITPADVRNALMKTAVKPVAVYITSPDYLGVSSDIKGIADVCHSYGVMLIVDNAHGAYLKFAGDDLHPLDLGADMCCDSAHKTLPVLTGGAYLHVSKELATKMGRNDFREKLKNIMSMFGSTSPSYLTLTSLDKCNEYLAFKAREDIKETISKIEAIKEKLKDVGLDVQGSDPLKLTIKIHDSNLADFVRSRNMEPEYSDRDYAVFMITPFNTDEELEHLKNVLIEYAGTEDFKNKNIDKEDVSLDINPFISGTVRFALKEKTITVDAEKAIGKICGFPLVTCPPAVPFVMPGELVTENVVRLAKYYGYTKLNVVETDYR